MNIQERNKEIIRKRKEGQSSHSLGKEYGLSHTQIIRICKGVK